MANADFNTYQHLLGSEVTFLEQCHEFNESVYRRCRGKIQGIVFSLGGEIEFHVNYNTYNFSEVIFIQDLPNPSCATL